MLAGFGGMGTPHVQQRLAVGRTTMRHFNKTRRQALANFNLKLNFGKKSSGIVNVRFNDWSKFAFNLPVISEISVFHHPSGTTCFFFHVFSLGLLFLLEQTC